MRTLKRVVDRGDVRWIFEADIESFFDSADRAEWKKMREGRVADGFRMRLIGKCVHVAVLDGEAFTGRRFWLPIEAEWEVAWDLQGRRYAYDNDCQAVWVNTFIIHVVFFEDSAVVYCTHAGFYCTAYACLEVRARSEQEVTHDEFATISL